MNRAEAYEAIQEGAAKVLEAKGVCETLDEQDAAAAVALVAVKRAAVLAAVSTSVQVFADVVHAAGVQVAVLAALGWE